ncbi:hypothetical protein OC835_007642, partial [Tilletia horrida]
EQRLYRAGGFDGLIEKPVRENTLRAFFDYLDEVDVAKDRPQSSGSVDSHSSSTSSGKYRGDGGSATAELTAILKSGAPLIAQQAITDSVRNAVFDGGGVGTSPAAASHVLEDRTNCAQPTAAATIIDDSNTTKSGPRSSSPTQRLVRSKSLGADMACCLNRSFFLALHNKDPIVLLPISPTLPGAESPGGAGGANPPQVKMLDRVERGAKQQTRANMSQSVATLKETGREETARVARAKRAKAARAKEGSAPPTVSAMGKAKSTRNKREAVALSAAAATATSAATVAAAAKVAAAKAMAAAARAAAEAAVAEAVAAEAEAAATEAAATEAEAATAATTPTPTPTPTPRSRTTAAPPPPKLKAATAAKSKTKKASKSKTAAAARPKAKKAAAKASKSKTAAAEALATSAESRAGKKGKEATTEEADSTSPKRQFAELEETTDAEGRTLVHYDVYDIHAIRIVDGKRQMYLQYRGWTDIENLGDQAGAELQAQQLVQRQGGYVPRPDVDNAPGILSSAGPLQAISDHAAEDTTPISPPLSPHRATAVLPPLSLQRFMPTASAPAIGVPTRDASNACPDADSDTDYDELDDEADDKVSTGSIPSATLSC